MEEFEIELRFKMIKINDSNYQLIHVLAKWLKNDFKFIMILMLVL